MTTQLCSAKKYRYPPPPLLTEGTLFSTPHPWNFRNFSTWLVTLWKGYFRKKSCCTIFLCERKKIFCDKMRKNLFIYVNTAYYELKDVLS